MTKTEEMTKNGFPENPGRPAQLVKGEFNDKGNVSRCDISRRQYGGAEFERLPKNPGIWAFKDKVPEKICPTASRDGKERFPGKSR